MKCTVVVVVQLIICLFFARCDARRQIVRHLGFETFSACVLPNIQHYWFANHVQFEPRVYQNS